MKIKLSDFDRFVIAQAHREVPVQGVEDALIPRYELAAALRLADAVKLTAKVHPDKLSRALTFVVDLPPERIELLISLAAGGGQAIKGDAVELLAEIVVRLRAALPRKKESAPPS